MSALLRFLLLLAITLFPALQIQASTSPPAGDIQPNSAVASPE